MSHRTSPTNDSPKNAPLGSTAGEERAFSAIPLNAHPSKPRTRGVTEIRGPYYAPVGRSYLEDLFDAMGAYVDTLKFAGGSFALMPKRVVRDTIDLCHRHDVRVSTGGFIEHVVTLGPRAVDAYLREAKDLGFDIVEISSGFITMPDDDFVRLVARAQQLGLHVKPEVGIQFGAGGATTQAELEAEGTKDVGGLIRLGRRLLDGGAGMLMIESEGITENVRAFRADVVSRIANELGIEHVMFEAADPDVFAWYVKNYGPETNLFVDHSQIVQLSCLRAGIWGTKSLWGRVVTYHPE